MSMNTIILTNLIYLTVLWYILSAVFFDQKNKSPLASKSGEKQLEDLQMRKEEALLAIKDLELDYKTHKIAEEEYLRMRQSAFDQGSELIKKIEMLKNKKPASSGLIQKFCINCGAPRPLEANFCGQCGKKLE